jgi:hypothetical protein
MGRASKSGKISGDFGQQFSSHKKQLKNGSKINPSKSC